MSLRPNRAAAAAAPYGAAPSPYGYGGGYYGGQGGAAAPPPAAAAGHSYARGGGGYSTNGTGSSSGGGYQQQQQQQQQQSYGGYTGGTPVYTTSPTAGSFKDKPKKRKSSAEPAGGNVVAFLLATLCVLLTIATLHFRGQRNQLLTNLDNAKSVRLAVEAHEQLQNDMHNCGVEKRRLIKAEKRLDQQVQTLEKELSGAKQMSAHSAEALDLHKEETTEVAERLQSRDGAWKDQVDVLQVYTQRESLRTAEERFGAGPHHVRFTVVLPSDVTNTPRYFVVECAPLALMPHAVHLFLEQVVHGLWNNAWFYLNGPHVLQGGPQSQDGEENHGEALRRFQELKLDTLAFPEYSEEFPHVQWTMGFTGRPGGPDFYINKMDNTEAHGPGGQHQHSLEEFADACFAKIIDGYETLELIYRETTFPDEHEWGWFYTQPVHIVGATLLVDPAPTPEGDPLVAGTAKDVMGTSPSDPGGEEDFSRFPPKPLQFEHSEHQVVP